MSFTSVYWIILGFIDVFAVIFNLFLIYLALCRTPKMIRTYTTLIINLAITDCCSAFLNFFVQQRMIPAGFSIGYVSYGWCSAFGYKVCFLSYNLMAHFIVHSNYSLLLSFAYRFYILSKPEPQRKTVMIVTLIAYIPSFVQLILYQFAQSEPSEIISIILSYHPNYDFSGLIVSGIADIRNVFALFKILQMTVLIVPVFSLILILRRKIIERLIYRGISISLNTKSLHSQLLMALTYQALLPALYSISVVIYVLEQSGIYSSIAMENYIMSGLVLIPFFSPFTSFFFFSPYRRFIVGLCLKRYMKRPSTLSDSMPASIPV